MGNKVRMVWRSRVLSWGDLLKDPNTSSNSPSKMRNKLSTVSSLPFALELHWENKILDNLGVTCDHYCHARFKHSQFPHTATCEYLEIPRFHLYLFIPMLQLCRCFALASPLYILFAPLPPKCVVYFRPSFFSYHMIRLDRFGLFSCFS